MRSAAAVQLWLLLGLLCVAWARIPPVQRKFNSTSINNVIANYTARMKVPFSHIGRFSLNCASPQDPVLAALFENCLPNTLDTTVQYFNPKGASCVREPSSRAPRMGLRLNGYLADNKTGLPDTFIITGDITATWLRDSTNQVCALAFGLSCSLHGKLIRFCALCVRRFCRTCRSPRRTSHCATWSAASSIGELH